MVDKGMVLTESEARRLDEVNTQTGPGSIHLKVCANYSKTEGKECRTGDACPFIHAIKERNLGRRERIFTQLDD